MSKLRVYEYKNCSTCKKALKWLDTRKISYQALPIVDQPPTKKELSLMLKFVKEQGGTFKNLFNTSGVVYRELGVAQKIKAGLSENEALEMLSQNGKLVKRPFLLSDKAGLVGFKEDDWKKSLVE